MGNNCLIQNNQLDVRLHADHDEIEYFDGGFDVVDS
jgi:hypothetical protein